jgi:hypothetical protein
LDSPSEIAVFTLENTKMPQVAIEFKTVKNMATPTFRLDLPAEKQNNDTSVTGGKLWI